MANNGNPHLIVFVEVYLESVHIMESILPIRLLELSLLEHAWDFLKTPVQPEPPSYLTHPHVNWLR